MTVDKEGASTLIELVGLPDIRLKSEVFLGI